MSTNYMQVVLTKVEAEFELTHYVHVQQLKSCMKVYPPCSCAASKYLVYNKKNVRR